MTFRAEYQDHPHPDAPGPVRWTFPAPRRHSRHTRHQTQTRHPAPINPGTPGTRPPTAQDALRAIPGTGARVQTPHRHPTPHRAKNPSLAPWSGVPGFQTPKPAFPGVCGEMFRSVLVLRESGPWPPCHLDLIRFRFRSSPQVTRNGSGTLSHGFRLDGFRPSGIRHPEIFEVRKPEKIQFTPSGSEATSVTIKRTGERSSSVVAGPGPGRVSCGGGCFEEPPPLRRASPGDGGR